MNKEEALNSIKIAEEFIAEMINIIATFNEEKIKEYHKKAVSLFKKKKSTPQTFPHHKPQ